MSLSQPLPTYSMVINTTTPERGSHSAFNAPPNSLFTSLGITFNKRSKPVFVPKTAMGITWIQIHCLINKKNNYTWSTTDDHLAQSALALYLEFDTTELGNDLQSTTALTFSEWRSTTYWERNRRGRSLYTCFTYSIQTGRGISLSQYLSPSALIPNTDLLEYNSPNHSNTHQMTNNLNYLPHTVTTDWPAFKVPFIPTRTDNRLLGMTYGKPINSYSRRVALRLVRPFGCSHWTSPEDDPPRGPPDILGLYWCGCRDYYEAIKLYRPTRVTKSYGSGFNCSVPSAATTQRQPMGDGCGRVIELLLSSSIIGGCLRATTAIRRSRRPRIHVRTFVVAI